MSDALMNTALEDALAHAINEGERDLVLDAWLRLGVSYIARERGRRNAVDALMAERAWVETADPRPPWPS